MFTDITLFFSRPAVLSHRESLEQVRRPRNQIEDWGTTKHNFVHERPPFFRLTFRTGLLSVSHVDFVCFCLVFSWLN